MMTLVSLISNASSASIVMYDHNMFIIQATNECRPNVSRPNDCRPNDMFPQSADQEGPFIIFSRHLVEKDPIRCHDIQYNDIQYNDIQYNDIQYNDIQ